MVAQAVLHALLQELPHYELVKLRNSGVRSSVEAIVPYTQRHFDRMDRLLKTTFTLDYTMKSAKILEPDETVCDLTSMPVNGGKQLDKMCADLIDDAVYRMDDADLRTWQEDVQNRLQKGTRGRKAPLHYVHKLTEDGERNNDSDED